MATKKETAAAQAVENAVETVAKAEAKAEEKDDGMVTIWCDRADSQGSKSNRTARQWPGETNCGSGDS